MNSRGFLVAITAIGGFLTIAYAGAGPKAQPGSSADSPPYQVTDAEKEQLEVVKLTLDAGIDPNQIIDKGYTLLHMAAEQNHLKVAELLIAKGAKTDVQAANGITPLHLAAEEGHLAMAELLLAKGAKVNPRDKHGLTPLAYAADAKRKKMVEFLRSKGGSGLETKYELTAEEAKYLVVVKASLDNADNPNAPVDAAGTTRLHVAAQKNYRTVAAFLLGKGARVDARDKSERTPLHLAAAAGNEVMVTFLLDSGADPKVKDREGNTPREAAAQAGHASLAAAMFTRQASKDTEAVLKAPLRLPGAGGGAELPKPPVPKERDVLADVKAYIEGGGKVDAADGIGFTRLHTAASYGHREVATYLLDHGAGVNARDLARHAPLHLAAQEGQTAVAELLLTKGADIEALNALQQTPLHLAAQQGQVDAVKLLLKKGAKRDARDMLGSTPLDLALAHKITDTPEQAAARAEAAKALQP